MKKGDWIIIGVILVVACIGFGIFFLTGKQEAGIVVISRNGKVIGEYPLKEDRKVKIGDGDNIIEIQDGTVRMKSASCPDHLCVKQGKISKNGENIICLPHKVVVTVKSGKESGIDAATN